MLPEGAKPILRGDDEPPRDHAAAKSSGRGGARVVGAVFAFAVIVGFGSLIAYYFIQNRDGSLDPASIPVVHADPRPMKVRPDNPGGIDVPFQNTEIYDRLGQQSGGAAGRASAGRTTTAGPGERLAPGPETPMPRPQPPPAPVAAIPAVPEIVAPADAVVVMPPQSRAPTPLVAATPQPAPAPAAPPVATPPAAARPAPVPAAPPQVATAPVAAGSARIQLASVRDAVDAQREWARVTRQYPDLLGNLSPQFVPADLGDRGVFIRVQAGPFASPEAARAACEALRARGAGCNVVR
ncbi:MAG: SPOR domain-containing protein [Proteobacteria bacterium]|nr:SPOR domain-containing protein [Pseudomonadota bacterium]